MLKVRKFWMFVRLIARLKTESCYAFVSQFESVKAFDINLDKLET